MSGIGRRGDKSADIDALIIANNKLKKKLQQVSAVTQDMSAAGSGLVGAAIPAQPFIITRRIRRKGELVTMAFFIDPNTTSVKAKIVASKDNPPSPLPAGLTALQATEAASIEHAWDDISDAERTAKYIVREFPHALEFNSNYGLIRTVAKNDESGLVATVKNPKTGPDKQTPAAPPIAFLKKSTDGVTLTNNDACWHTGDSTGMSGNENCGTAEIGTVLPRPVPTDGTKVAPNDKYVAATKTTPRGVKATLNIIVPKNATQVRVRLAKTADVNLGNFKNSVAYRWDIVSSDLQPCTVTGAEADAMVFTGEFGVKLDPATSYETIRIECNGDNVGGSDIEKVYNPTSGAARIANGTINGASIGFSGTTVPSTPTSADILNTIENDGGKTLLTVYASDFRATTGHGGTGPGGAVSWDDVGADSVFAVVNRASDSADAQHIVAGGPITDTTQSSVQIEVPGLIFGKQYTWKRNIATSGGQKSVAVASTPVTFRAGGEINLSLLSDVPGFVAGTKLAITSVLLEDPRHSVVQVQYNEPTVGSAVLIKNIRMFKDVQEIQNGSYKEVEKRVLIEDADNFTAGAHPLFAFGANTALGDDLTFTVQHPQNSHIRYKARITAVSGGTPSYIEALYPLNGSYVLTSSEPTTADSERPQYSGQRSDGQANSSPFRIPKMIFRWKPNNILIKLNLPDLFMSSFFDVRIALIVTVKQGFPLQPVNFYINPFPNPATYVQGDPGVSNDDYYFSVGLKAHEQIDFVRPKVDGSDAGDLPTDVYNALLGYPIGSIQAAVYFFNRTTTSTNGNPYLIVQSLPITFSSGDPVKAFLGTAGVNQVI